MVRFSGIAQGVQRSVTGVAMILGPLWGGALTRRLYLMLGVMAALEVILGVSDCVGAVCVYLLMCANLLISCFFPQQIMMFFSFHRLKVPEQQMPSQYDEIGTQNERQPLLA